MILAETAEQIPRNIDRYHTIFLICLIAGICFFLVAVALFFVLKIPKVFMVITGLSKKKEIKQMDDSVAYTSQLMKLKTGKLPKKEPSRRKNRQQLYSTSGKLNVKQGTVPVTQINPDSPDADPRSETTLLSNTPDDSLGTTVLSHDIAEQETSLLSREEGHQQISPEEFNFKIERETLLIHTDEDIL